MLARVGSCVWSWVKWVGDEGKSLRREMGCLHERLTILNKAIGASHAEQAACLAAAGKDVYRVLRGHEDLFLEVRGDVGKLKLAAIDLQEWQREWIRTNTRFSVDVYRILKDHETVVADLSHELKEMVSAKEAEEQPEPHCDFCGCGPLDPLARNVLSLPFGRAFLCHVCFRTLEDNCKARGWSW